MYFAGTTNKWKHTAMKYNSSTGDWEIALNLTGAGDNGGAQRFKVTSAANWKGTVWGDAGGNSLCSNQSSHYGGIFCFFAIALKTITTGWSGVFLN